MRPSVAAALAAIVTACAFDPRYLETERPVSEVDEIAGLVAADDGFRFAGTRVLAYEGGARVILAAGDDGRPLWTRTHAAGDHPSDRVQGLLALPDGRVLGFGYGGAGLAFLLGADGSLRWQGPLGRGQFARAAALGAGERILLAGQVPGDDSAPALWVAVARIEGDALQFVGESVARPGVGATSGDLLAAAARPDGGFLVGGYTSDGNAETAFLLAVDAEGRLDETNLHPDGPAPRGRVGALLALADGDLGLAGEDAAGRAFVGVRARSGAWRSTPRPFCAGGRTPSRPVSLTEVDGDLAVAGWSEWGRQNLFLARTATDGSPRWLRSFGPQSDAGAQRAAVLASPAGGLALVGNLCADRGPDAARCSAGEVEPHFWHLDPEGAPFGEPETFACP
jgi:hypothetical protein